MARTAEVTRSTKETTIRIVLDLDGTGQGRVSTGIGFFDHMLDAFARHSLMDIELEAQGDLHIDGHHTVEDAGIVLGQALARALGEKRGVVRFGSAFAPLDEALARAVVDLSGRGYLVCRAELAGTVGGFDASLTKEFFHAVATHAELNLHLEALYGNNLHHQIEALFKACALALRQAVALDPRVEGVPSTKGTL